MEPVTVGVIGCGNISDAYFAADETFDVIDIVACADIDLDRAEQKAAQHDIPKGCAPEELLADPEIEVVINITPPAVHVEVCLQILEAGKHAYVEKPFGISTAEARAVLETARENDLLVGAAPDTFLGAGLQTCRSVIESGRIGEPIGATAIWTSPGHESWHPNPEIFYGTGGGPMFDMGPYYLTALVFLLGPVVRVAGSTTAGFAERTITAESRRGETFDVEVPTHESGVLTFESGQVATVTTSYDVQGSTFPFPAFEIYGTEGSLSIPDPNHFEGPVRVRERGEETFEEIPLTHEYTDGRGAGVADMAYAIRSDWEQRASGALGYHVLEIMEGVRNSSEGSEYVELDAELEQPAPLPPEFPDV